jgi:hypothetical protein
MSVGQVIIINSSSLTCSRNCFQTHSQPLLAFQKEAVRDIARIQVGPDDRPRRVEAKGGGAL